jgi:hypothetical protein
MHKKLEISPSLRLSLAWAVVGLGLTTFAMQAIAMPLETPAAAVGQWDLSLLESNQKCRLTLREAGPSNLQSRPQNIRIPAGCRETIPILDEVDDWAVTKDQHLELIGASGQTVLDFASRTGRILAAQGPSGETYELIAINAPAAHATFAAPTAQPVANAVAVAAIPAQDAVLEAKLSANKAAPLPIRSSEIPGRYAVLRAGGKDTGCMVTLDSTTGPQGNRAMLAPACRDQGIVVFDPAGWQIVKGQLVLIARKGHSVRLDPQSDGTFIKDAKEGKVLGLKRL